MKKLELMNSDKTLTEQECLKIMDQFIDNQNEPKVGIFWYDKNEEELFGVESIDAALIKGSTINKLHRTVWSKEHNRRKGKGLPLERWAGDYKDTPRGRVFCEKGEFVVKVGSWINDHPEAKQLIIEEFDLQKDVKFEIECHWEIGEGYER